MTPVMSVSSVKPKPNNEPEDRMANILKLKEKVAQLKLDSAASLAETFKLPEISKPRSRANSSHKVKSPK